MTHHTDSRSLRYYFLFIYLFLSISYFIFGTFKNEPYKIESDGKYYYQYLVSLFFDRDIDFSNNYRLPKYNWMLVEIDHYKLRDNLSPITGRPINIFTIGPAILWFPFFIFVYSIGLLVNELGFSIDMNPFGKYMQYSVMYSAVIYGTITLYLLYKFSIRYFSKLASCLAVWLILVTTSLYYYIIFEPSMSHLYDLFTYTLFLFLFWKCLQEDRFSLYPLCGLVGALHILVRTQNLVTILLFSLLLLLRLKEYKQPKLYFKLSAYISVLVIGLLPIPIINNYLYGSPFIIPQGNNFINLASPHILQVLFSLKNGLFSHHPLLLVGLIGYIVFILTYRQALEKRILLVILLAFLLQVYINSSVWDWWAGTSFGQRRLLSSLPLFTLGFAYLLERASLRYPVLYKRLYFPTVALLSILGLYLTMIHIFLWDSNQPHNIFKWMFHDAPILFFKNIAK